uniref:class I SAM-dependent methyltransferase n=1 Tax=Candidatus Electronema sp. TaxID=2698783 RepID=UPI0040570CC4
MKEKHEWEQRYEKEELPWDSGRPASCLTELIGAWPKFDGKVLEVGCGTGTNSVWLAGQGLHVTGMDIAAGAVRLARQRAAENGVECRFIESDFLNDPLEEGAFAFLFDRGCFHGMDEEHRALFARRAAACLERGGLWFSLIGNADQPSQGDGPPRLSAGQICAAVEPFFEILRLESFLLDSKRSAPPRFWQCLMRVRK